MEKDQDFKYLEGLYELVHSSCLKQPDDDETDLLFKTTARTLNDVQTTKISTKLLLLTLLKHIFEKRSVHTNGAYCTLLLKRGIIPLLVSYITDDKKNVLLHCLKECIVAILTSTDQENNQDRMFCLKLVMEKIRSTAVGSVSRTTVIEILMKIVSSEDNQSNSDIPEEVLLHLYDQWPNMVQQELKMCLSSDHTDVYSLVPFLKLWKKLLRLLLRTKSPSSEYLVYLNSLDILKNTIESMPVHLCCDALDVMCAMFKQNITNKPSNEVTQSIRQVVYQFLQPSELTKMLSLMQLQIQGGFLGVCNKFHNAVTYVRNDQKLAKKVVFLCLECCSYYSDASKPITENLDRSQSILLVCNCLYELKRQLKEPLCVAIISMFQEQDDHMIQAFLSLLLVYNSLKEYLSLISTSSEANGNQVKRQKMSSNSIMDSVYCDINPHKIFLTFLQSTNWDSSLLLDFIISPETCFLQYFTKYLKCAIEEWDWLLQICEDFELSAENEMHVERSKCSEMVSNKVCMLDSLQNSEADSITSHSAVKLNGVKNHAINISLNVNSCVGSKTCIFSSSSKKETVIQSNIAKLNNDTDVDDSTQEVTQCISESQSKSVVRGGLVNYSDSSDSECDIDIKDCVGSISVGNQRTGNQGVGNQGDNVANYVSLSSDLEYDEEDVMLTQNEGKEFHEHSGKPNVVIDKFMSVLIRLGLGIERMVNHNLFPFKVDHLLYLIHTCESKYET